MTTYNYLGWGLTDSNGVAHLDHDANGDAIEHSYTGVGAGEVDVVASLDNPVSSGSIVSETYSLIDAIFYDSGLNDGTKNTKWVNQKSGFNVELTSNGTHITEVNPANFIPSTVANSTNWIDRLIVNVPYKVEFKLTSVVSQIYFRIYNFDGSESQQVQIDNSGTYEVTVNSDSIVFKLNGTTIKTLNVGIGSTSYVAFATIGNDATTSEITFKDFKMYSI